MKECVLCALIIAVVGPERRRGRTGDGVAPCCLWPGCGGWIQGGERMSHRIMFTMCCRHRNELLEFRFPRKTLSFSCGGRLIFDCSSCVLCGSSSLLLFSWDKVNKKKWKHNPGMFPSSYMLLMSQNIVINCFIRIWSRVWFQRNFHVLISLPNLLLLYVQR